jgi:glutamate racemase
MVTEVATVDGRPIGVFDSGFGGVTVLASAARLLPEEDFIFLGDNRRAPYGDRTPDEVLAFTHEAVERLNALDCKAILIACNTATSAAAETIRGEWNMPIIGMEPALKPASLLPGEGAVLVMATAMTLKLPKFQRLMERYGSHAVPVPCPGLVELVEAGETDGPRVREKLDALLSPYLKGPVKAVVLGCTHYVFLKPALTALLPEGVALVDGNEGTARPLRRRLAQKDLLKPSVAGAKARTGEPVFLSTEPGEAVPARMRALFRAALRAADACCISPDDAVQ